MDNRPGDRCGRWVERDLMPVHRPPDLRASKTCVVCGRPFHWRKKWEKVWNEVKYCSERCRSRKNLVEHAKSA